MLAVKRVTTLLICSMSEPWDELLRAAGSECSDGKSSSVRPAEPARWLSVLMGDGERGRAGAGKCSSASTTSYKALGPASGGSGPPPPAPAPPATAPLPAPPAHRPRLSVLLGKGLMTAVWLGFSFLLMWMDSRCHRCCPRLLFSFCAHVTDFPLELRREERQEVTPRGPGREGFPGGGRPWDSDWGGLFLFSQEIGHQRTPGKEILDVAFACLSERLLSCIWSSVHHDHGSVSKGILVWIKGCVWGFCSSSETTRECNSWLGCRPRS